MQITAPMKHHFTPISMDIMKNKTNKQTKKKRSVGEDVEKVDPCALQKGMLNYAATVGNGTVSPSKITHRIIIESSNSTPAMYPEAVGRRTLTDTSRCTPMFVAVLYMITIG